MKDSRNKPTSLRLALLAPCLALVALTAACKDDLDALLETWNQGFEEDTAGWYDATTAGALGWCGSIARVTADSVATGPAPSAGDAYGTVSSGPCNELWSSAQVLFGAPYAPGVDLSLASNPFPRRGYETDLDIYLDPAWGENFRGNLEFVGEPASKLILYGATILENGYELGDFHTGPHYFVDIEAVGEGDSLNVGGYSVTEPGWFTFRFSFADNDGVVQVDFELLDHDGGLLATVENIAPTELLGPVRVPFAGPVQTENYSTGWVWFFDIAAGLALPIDEHIRRFSR